MQNTASLTVITWNVSFSLGLAEAPGVRPWAERVNPIANYVRDADVFAVQEASNRQLTDLRASLPGHECVAVTTPLPEAIMPAVRMRYGPNMESTVTEIALFLSREWFSVTGYRHCWLSPKPDVPLSIGFGNLVPRQLLQVVCRHRSTGRTTLIGTTHIDWRAVAPMMSVVKDRMATQVGEADAAVLMGDLNTHTAPAALGELLHAGWRDAHPSGRLDDDVTYLGDLGGGPGRIDHVLVAGAVDVECWWRGADVATLGLSDHLPVGASLRLTGDAVGH